MHLSTYSILHSKNRHPNKTFFLYKNSSSNKHKKAAWNKKIGLDKNIEEQT